MEHYKLETQIVTPEQEDFQITEIDTAGFEPGDKISFRLKTEAPNIFAFDVDGKKNVVAKADHYNDTPGVKLYSNKMMIKASNPSPGSGREVGILHTQQDSNNIRLLVTHLDKNRKATGGVRIREVSIISQTGKFFLVDQPVYDFHCYRSGGQMTATQHFRGADNEWLDLLHFIEDVFLDCEQFRSLPTEPPDMAPRLLVRPTPGVGTVDWFNAHVGMAAIRTVKGTARVHYSDIAPREEGFRYLRSGELVSYKELTAPVNDGKKTGFSLQAHGVRVVQNASVS